MISGQTHIWVNAKSGEIIHGSKFSPGEGYICHQLRELDDPSQIKCVWAIRWTGIFDNTYETGTRYFDDAITPQQVLQSISVRDPKECSFDIGIGPIRHTIDLQGLFDSSK